MRGWVGAESFGYELAGTLFSSGYPRLLIGGGTWTRVDLALDGRFPTLNKNLSTNYRRFFRKRNTMRDLFFRQLIKSFFWQLVITIKSIFFANTSNY